MIMKLTLNIECAESVGVGGAGLEREPVHLTSKR